MFCFGSATPVSAIVGRGFPLWLAASLRLIIAVVVLVPLLAVRARDRSRRGVLDGVRQEGLRLA